jgi:hypothetical protein
VKRSVDTEQPGMLHNRSAHSLVSGWFSWPGAGAMSRFCSGVVGCRDGAGQGHRREGDDVIQCPDRRGARGYPVTSARLLRRSRLMLDGSGPHSEQWTVAVIGFGVRVFFGHHMRRATEVGLTEMSVVEQRHGSVGGEGQKVCCGRCGAMLGCPGRRCTLCSPVSLQSFRFVGVLTHANQQGNVMGVWS